MKHRLIDEIFPIKEIGNESSSEKKKGHISSLHVWWARRPLAASRASIYASLVGPPKDLEEWATKGDFISNLSKWDNSNNLDYIIKAQKEIEKTIGSRPKVLDPFAGGGSIPLEALRLGCETFASDYNPISFLLLKCTLEFPQKYSQELNSSLRSVDNNQLIDSIKKWSNWIVQEVSKNSEKYYKQEDDLKPYAYFWSRVIHCQNPKCKAEIPLYGQYWLSKKKKISLYPSVLNNKISFKIVGGGYEKTPKDFNPDKGSISQAIATCLVCSSTIDDNKTRKLFSSKEYFEKLIAISFIDSKSKKSYRVASERDLKIFKNIEEDLTSKQNKLLDTWMLEPIPNEFVDTPIHKEYEIGGLFYNFLPLVLYGFTKWGDLFNHRQKLVLLDFMDNIKKAYFKIKQENNDEVAKIVVSYLTLAFNRLLTRCNTFTVWHSGSEQTEKIFAIQAIFMKWSYPEVNPLVTSNATSFIGNIDSVIEVLEHLVAVPKSKITVKQTSATNLDYTDEFFDAIVTDPPYYDMVPYSSLSDFFYVWDKRILGDVYPELFSTLLTPKSSESISDLPLLRGLGKNKAEKEIPGIKSELRFEESLNNSFKEMYRVLKSDGVLVLVYAHKSTKGWESLIRSLLNSGFVVTSSWPLNTEMKSRMRAKESATLASSIYMVARKLKKEEIGNYREIKTDLKKHLHKKLDIFWNSGISGSDFFISAIGSAIEIFGKYQKVLDDNDNEVDVTLLLNDVRNIVTDYTIGHIVKDEIIQNISQLTKFYALWRWAFKDTKATYDAAIMLSHSVGIDIDKEINKGFIKKDKEFIRILGPSERNLDNLNSTEMIDVLHNVIMLWKNNKRKEMIKVLKDSGFGSSDVFYKVAQAISESNPGSSESKLLDGFLSSKLKIMDDVGSNDVQTKLD